MSASRPVILAVLVSVCGGATYAQAPAAAGASGADRIAHAHWVGGPITEADWNQSEALTGFVQREPDEGKPVSYETEARVIADATALHVRVRAVDPQPERIVGYLNRRDVDSKSDWIHIFIDSYHDRRTAYQFAVNAAGVKRDAYWYNDDNNDDSWDAVWDVTVSRNPTGWSAEFSIPYSQLRFSAGGNGRIGFSVFRFIARLNETSSWPLSARSVNGMVSQFGELDGISPSGASKRLELVPYSLAKVSTQPAEAGNPLRHSTDADGVAGLDLKYAVTRALSLTATVNPDFGQVEADPAVVNLGAFETFFQERRPFFIEGSGTYRFECHDGCELFYSRRIGRQPRGAPTLADNEYAVQPPQSTILGAGKLTGRVGSFAVGALAAATQEETAEIAFGSARRREVVEPASLYSVSRARREFAHQSALGFMLTTTNRRLTDSVSFLPGSAVAGGLDYDVRIGKRWSLNGYWSGSTVHGTPQAISGLQQSNVHSFQRPDAGHVDFEPLATSMSGHAGAVNFGKISGEKTRMNVSAFYKSPGFDVNDVGFLQRADTINLNSWFQVRWNKPGRVVRERAINVNEWWGYNFDGDRLSLGGNVNAFWSFVNNWGTGGGVNVNKAGFDDRRTRGGPGALTNDSISGWHWISSDDRKPVQFSWNWSYGTDGTGENWDISPNVTLKPTAALSTEFGISLNRNIEDSQWIDNVERAGTAHSVFGRLYQTTTSMTTRVNYTLTPNLSLQVYAQPFVSAGRYEKFRELVNGLASRYEDRYAAFDYGGNPDFRVLSFRTTNVMRWEFRPGSTLFVVWQQAKEGFVPDGTFRFGRDYSDVFSTPSVNTFLVKFAYWLNP